MEDTQEQKKGPGRPRKTDLPSVQGAQNIERAKEERVRKTKTQVVEQWFELVVGKKLVLCKRTNRGNVHRTFQGSIDDKANGKKVAEFVKELHAKGQLRTKI